MDSDINYVVLALENHREMLEQLFGSGKKDTPEAIMKEASKGVPALTPALFDSAFPEERPNVIRFKIPDKSKDT